MPAPTVFLSSTSLDLKPYRAAALDAARAAGFAAICMEDFAASGRRYTLAECLHQVDKADVLVVLVAHRYGWVPPGQTKSVTWLECEHARENKNKKIDVIALVVNEEYKEWPYHLREAYRYESDPPEQVTESIRQLKAFKQWLSNYITVPFTTPADVKAEVYKALTEWLKEKDQFGPPPPGNPSGYLDKLREATRYIKIEGIQISGHPTQQFGIRQIFIPLATAGGVGHEREVPLQRALANRKLVIIGQPGAGKTTFLRRVAFELCHADEDDESAAAFLGFRDGSLPILIRIFELDKHINAHANHRSAPDNPAWIVNFLEQQAQDHHWGLAGDFFRGKLAGGPCRILLDGLDEASGTASRRNMVRLIEQAAIDYPNCHFVVTTRPAGETQLHGFETVRLADLGLEAIHTFLDEWSAALFEREPEKSTAFRDKLKRAIGSRKEIRALARNPVMLTALAVLQANNRELPQHRVELYEEILNWLAKAREGRPGRVEAERCLKLLKKLAFAMQTHGAGRKRQTGIGWAVDQIAGDFPDRGEAEQFLEKEQTDSGIIVSRGSDVEFWHLTFLEYLVARFIGGLSDAEQYRIVMLDGNLYKPEWREVMLLLGCVLMKQGSDKVDGLIKAVLDGLGEKPELPAQARCAALLGAMMRDLQRMDYEPKDPRFTQTLRAMQSLFDPVQSGDIDIKTRIEAAEAVGQAGDPRLEQENWISIQGGKFWMGAQKQKGRNQDEEADDDEAPVHEVTLKEFHIGRYPVTVQEYQKFIDEGGYENEEYWRETGGFGQFTEPENWEEQQPHGNRPVTGVSWYEAAAYCTRAAGRLPREAEWERAARGARENAKYPWGNEPIDETRANYELKVGRPTPVGVYPKGVTTEGVDDMMGNVWEWCSDWYGPYPNGPVDDPLGPQSRERKVLRGGSWYGDQYDVRVSVRGHSLPENRDAYIGFRCVRESLNP